MPVARKVARTGQPVTAGTTWEVAKTEHALLIAGGGPTGLIPGGGLASSSYAQLLSDAPRTSAPYVGELLGEAPNADPSTGLALVQSWALSQAPTFGHRFWLAARPTTIPT